MNIGLTQRILYHNQRAYDCTDQGWYSLLSNHRLIYIPNDLKQGFSKLAESLDALIITGGDDLALRRATELKIASYMLKQFKPILGVCHGAFLLTDILGGRLEKDKSHQDVEHDVYYYGESHRVNSHHSNVIAEPYSDARVLATDDDGNCEAFIDNNVSGIVWHPERMEKPWLPSEIANTFQIYT